MHVHLYDQAGKPTGAVFCIGCEDCVEFIDGDDPPEPDLDDERCEGCGAPAFTGQFLCRTCAWHMRREVEAIRWETDRG